MVEQTSLNPMASLSYAKSSDSIINWATVLSKSKSVLRNGALDFHPHDALGSKKTVEITAEDVSLATNKWNCAVIAQILGDNSSLEAVQKFAEAKWNDFGLLEVQKLDNELFIFRFKSEESKNQVLEESLVFYGSKMMYLRPWVPNKPIEKLSLLTVPIWIKLPGLGLQYFTVQALSKLGSLIGRPLFADKDTIDQSRLSYARMCVEIKADDDEKLPDVIVFKNEFGVEIVQEVEYEWVPPRCTFCKLFGHDTNLCIRHCVPDLEAEAGRSDRKSGQLENMTAENEEVDLKAASGDEEKSENNNSLLPEKTRISRNKACPCGSKKKYKACCGFVDGRSSCNDEVGSHEKKDLLPEEKSISRNKACPCGSKEKYRSCCKLAAGGSSEGESQENLVPEEKKISRNKPCPCGSVRKYKKCCGATCKKKFSRNKGCPCGSTKEYDKCCGSVAEVLLPIEDEWIICT